MELKLKAPLSQTLARFMKSRWAQFHFCQQPRLYGHNGFFFFSCRSLWLSPSICVSWKQNVCKTPFPSPPHASALKVYFIHIENEVISELRPIVSLAQGESRLAVWAGRAACPGCPGPSISFCYSEHLMTSSITLESWEIFYWNSR